MYAGVDLGLKESGVAVIKGLEVEFYTIRNEKLAEFLQENAKIVSIDAPLTRGEVWRDCDRAISWLKPLPLNLPAMKKLMEKGISLRKEIEDKLTVIESFATGIRKILGIEFQDLGYKIKREPNKHEEDAGFLAFNSFLYRYGATEGYGKSCQIHLPMKKVGDILMEQIELKDKVKIENPKEIKYVAGVDVHYKAGSAYAAAVVLKKSKAIEEKSIKVGVDFPYVPTLLAGRELKPIIKVLEGLRFDAVAINAQGLGHPRLGLASHVGILLDKPSLGITKKLLCGDVQGDRILLEGKEIGKFVDGVYVTIGHRFNMRALQRYAKIFTRAVREAHLLAKASQSF